MRSTKKHVMAALLSFLGCFILMTQPCQGVDNVNITVLVNDSAILPCNVGDVGSSIWLATMKNSHSGTPRALTSGNATFQPYLHRLNVTKNADFFTYNLIIIAANQDTEGTYICKEEGVQRSSSLLFVEVPPTVWLELHNSKLGDRPTLDVTLHEEYEIRCFAEGGRPSVTLSWEIDNATVTEGTKQRDEDENKISTVINYRPKLHETRLSCRTDGQKIVPSIHSDVFLNVLHKPICNIDVQQTNQVSNTYRIHCVCVGNPDVSGVFLATNNSMYVETSTSALQTNYPTKIRCKGRNTVGYSETATKTIIPDRIIDVNSTKMLSEKPRNDERHEYFVVIITSLVILVFLLASTLVAVTKVSRSRLNSEVEITSHYFAGDLNDNGHVWSVDRSRLPSPVFARRDVQEDEDEEMYEWPQMDQQRKLTTNPQRTLKAQSSTSAVYECPNVVYEMSKNPIVESELSFERGSTIDPVYWEQPAKSNNDTTVPPADATFESILKLPSDERKPVFRNYATVNKPLKTTPAILNEKSYGFSNTVSPPSVSRADIPSMSSCTSNFSDSSYFAFDVNAVPCEIYERFSKFCKERGDSVRLENNDVPGGNNIL